MIPVKAGQHLLPPTEYRIPCVRSKTPDVLANAAPNKPATHSTSPIYIPFFLCTGNRENTGRMISEAKYINPVDRDPTRARSDDGVFWKGSCEV